MMRFCLREYDRHILLDYQKVEHVLAPSPCRSPNPPMSLVLADLFWFSVLVGVGVGVGRGGLSGVASGVSTLVPWLVVGG